METIGKIRRHKVKGESVSAIARDLSLSRNTVKKYLNAEVDPVYQRNLPICWLNGWMFSNRLK